MKVFKLDGQEYASICCWQNPKEKLIIDVNMDTFSAREARAFAKWLLEAAEYIELANRKKKK